MNTTHNYAELHALLDSLTDGEHVKATWKMDRVEDEVAVEGPVYIGRGRHCSCRRIIRWADGEINKTLTSFEIARTEDVTVSHEAVDTLNALLDWLLYSRSNGQEVTAERRSKDGSMTITETVQTSGTNQEVRDSRHPVTVRRTVVQRWEREGDDPPLARTH